MTLAALSEPRLGPTTFRRAFAATSVCGGGTAAGWLSAVQPTLAVTLAAVSALVIATHFQPGWVLAGGTFLGLTSPASIGVAQYAPKALVLAGLVCLVRLLFRRTSQLPQRTTYLLVLLGLLVISASLSRAPSSISAYLACAGAVLVAILIRVEQRRWVEAFVAASLAFVAATAVLGDFDPTGLRFAGVSGNPNRMVFGLLIAVCFLTYASFSSKSWTMRLVLAGVGVVVAYMIVLSGSDQGIFGLGVCAAAVVVCVLRRSRFRAVFGVLSIAAMTALIGLQVSNSNSQDLSRDTTTLSGRTPIYSAGIDEFLESPILGTGNARVEVGYGAARSTHNSVVGVGLTAGIVALALWCLILAGAVQSGIAMLRRGNYLGTAALIVVVTQFVQQIEMVSVTWAVFALVGSLNNEGKSE